MIIAERGCPSRIVEQLLQSTKALLNFLLKGPRSTVSKQKTRFYWTTPTSCMVQPGLSAHTVLTVSEGPALVAGFEGKSNIDTQRQQQMLNYYFPGLQRERKLLAYRNFAYTKERGYLADTQLEKTELGQHTECFQIDGKQRFVG